MLQMGLKWYYEPVSAAFQRIKLRTRFLNDS